MRKLTVLSLVAVFVLSLSVPALASISMSGQVTTRFQSIDADTGVNEDNEAGFQDALANLQIMGDVTAGVNAFVELDIGGETDPVDVYEAYLTLDDLFTFTDIKLGKFEINYGSQSARGSRNADVQDNLLVGNPLVMPVASQSGIEFSGLFGKAAWSLSATNGMDEEDFEKDRGTAIAAKVWGELSPVLPGLSGGVSYYAVDHSDADHPQVDNLFGNAGGNKVAAAPYSDVSANDVFGSDNKDTGDISAWQVDLAYDMAELGIPAEIAAFLGKVENGDDEYDYWNVETSYELTPRAYLAVRYGELEKDVDGDYDVDRLQAGLGYNLASGVLAKLEYVDQGIGDNVTGYDEFDGVVGEMSVSF